MLQSELKKLQELGDSLQPIKACKGDMPADNLLLRNEIENECRRVKDALTKAIFSQPKENLVERYIQFHQAGIIGLADQLQAYLSGENGPEENVITGFFISQLFELLNYIERFFSKYFNPEATIPDSYRLVALKQLSEPLDLVLSFIENVALAPSLQHCLLDYLQSFSDEKFPNHLNFRDLIYLKTFLTELEHLLGLKDISNWDHKLFLTLVYLNFNHLGFFTYCQDSVRAELENADWKAQHLSILSHALTEIKSLQSKPSFSYHPGWPNIKTMLETWLSDEISSAVLHREKGPVISSEGKETEKLVLNLSVAQIGCMTRMFYEENCYATASVTDVLKFTASHYRSKRQDHISTGSLSKEYYGINQVTAATVRDLFQRMVVRINKYYFPVWAAASAAIFGLS